jgi:V-type H+-transporting ATPase subunit C
LTNPTILEPSSNTNDSIAAASEGPTGWSWNRAKYRVEGRALTDVVDALAKDMQSLDTIHKQKLSSYNIAKGQLAVLQRKRTGNLATRDLSTVVEKDQLPDLEKSEYLETVFVAVPKTATKEFETKYERLSSMVVPRSAM